MVQQYRRAKREQWPKRCQRFWQSSLNLLKLRCRYCQTEHNHLARMTIDNGNWDKWELLSTRLARDVDRNAIIQCIPPQNHPGQSLSIWGTKKLTQTIIVVFIICAIQFCRKFLLSDKFSRDMRSLCVTLERFAFDIADTVTHDFDSADKGCLPLPNPQFF